MISSISRRTVLRVATAIGGAVLAGPPASRAATASANTPESKISWSEQGLGESSFFVGDWASAGTAFFPRAIDVGISDVRRLFVAKWDSRLFQIEPLAQLDSDELDAPTQTVVIGAESGVATLAVPAGVSTVLFRVRAINLYPQENVGAAVDTSFQLNSEAGEEIARAVLSATYRAASPWGAEILVTWLCVDGQILPGVTEVCSMGPKPIPPGTHLALRCSNGAPEMVGLINGDEGRSISSSQVDLGDGLQETLFILADEIATGDKLVIVSAAKTSNSEPSEFGISLPAVVLRPSEGDFEVRDTRLLAAYPVTPSGTPLSSFVPTPSVLNREIEKE